jgi:hypothetical protein
MWFFKKTSPRRTQVRKKAIESPLLRFAKQRGLASAGTDYLISTLLVFLFIILFVFIFSFDAIQQHRYLELIPRVILVSLISLGAAFYIHHYQKRIMKNYTRAIAITSLF